MISLLTPHQTRSNPKIDALAARTAPGMAHFAGTGPRGETCGHCSHFDGKHQLCNKFIELTKAQRRRGAPKIKSNLAACKYFEPKPTTTKQKFARERE